MNGRARSLSLLLALMVAALGSAPASAGAARSTNKRHKRRSPVSHCGRVPVGWTVVARDARAVIIKRNLNRTDRNGTTITWSWRYCLRPRGRFYTLYRDSSGYGGYGDIVTYTDPVLSGRYAATTVTDWVGGGRYGCKRGMNILDLMTAGAVVSAGVPIVTCAVSISGLAVNPRGFAAWRETGPYSPPTLRGVSCPSPSLCVAVDQAGNVITSTNPTGGTAAWTIAHVDSNVDIASVSCPSASLCVAVDGAGKAITSTDPTGGAAAWRITRVESSSRYMTAVSCPSASLCVAVDGAGNVITSSNPTGGPGAWTVTNIIPESSNPTDQSSTLRGVSCPSTSLCVATDMTNGDVITSTNPTGGVAAWTVTHVGPNGVGPYSISCPSTSLCVVGEGLGSLLTSNDPTGGASAWTATNIPAADIQALSCPSMNLCVAGDNASNLLVSINPTGGGAAWTASTLPPPVAVIGLSCPMTSFCAAAETNGGVLTSTTPADGAGAWPTANTPPACTPQSCLVTKIIAHDDHGTRVLDTSAPSASASLGQLSLSGNLLTWIDNGIQHQAKLG